MSFDEVRFPTNIEFGFVGGPEYNTDIEELFSGYEQRNQNWLTPRMLYTSSHVMKDQGQINQLIAFFRMRKGKANGFRFRDWTDFQISGQVIGTGNGATSDFQIVKTYTSGTSEQRVIYKIVRPGQQLSILPAVYLNGVLQVSGYTIGYNNGIISFATPPGNGVIVSCDCEYDVPVRFDTDSMAVRAEYNKEYYWENISLIEIRINPPASNYILLEDGSGYIELEDGSGSILLETAP